MNLNDRAYRIIMDTAENKAGLNINAGTHTLRKTFGYHHYKKYRDIAKLQAILNHSKPGETLDYIGITQEEADQSMAQKLFFRLRKNFIENRAL